MRKIMKFVWQMSIIFISFHICTCCIHYTIYTLCMHIAYSQNGFMGGFVENSLRIWIFIPIIDMRNYWHRMRYSWKWKICHHFSIMSIPSWDVNVRRHVKNSRGKYFYIEFYRQVHVQCPRYCSRLFRFLWFHHNFFKIHSHCESHEKHHQTQPPQTTLKSIHTVYS